MSYRKLEGLSRKGCTTLVLHSPWPHQCMGWALKPGDVPEMLCRALMDFPNVVGKACFVSDPRQPLHESASRRGSQGLGMSIGAGDEQPRSRMKAWSRQPQLLKRLVVQSRCCTCTHLPLPLFGRPESARQRYYRWIDKPEEGLGLDFVMLHDVAFACKVRKAFPKPAYNKTSPVPFFHLPVQSNPTLKRARESFWGTERFPG